MADIAITYSHDADEYDASKTAHKTRLVISDGPHSVTFTVTTACDPGVIWPDEFLRHIAKIVDQAYRFGKTGGS